MQEFCVIPIQLLPKVVVSLLRLPKPDVLSSLHSMGVVVALTCILSTCIVLVALELIPLDLESLLHSCTAFAAIHRVSVCCLPKAN